MQLDKTDDQLVNEVLTGLEGLYSSQATPGFPKPMNPPLTPCARLVGDDLQLTVYTEQYGAVTFDLHLAGATLLQAELAKAINSKYIRLLRDGMGTLL